MLLFLYYTLDRRNISPAPLLCLPLYDAAVAGYLAAAIAIPAFYMTVGLFVVDVSTHQSLVSLAAEFLPEVGVLVLAILLGEVVRSRRAGRGDRGPAAPGQRGTRSGDGPPGCRGATADRPGTARHRGAQHGHHHRAGRVRAARTRAE